MGAVLGELGRLVDPTGATVPLTAAEAVERAGAVTVKKKLERTGVWRLVLAARGAAAGHFTYSWKLKQPKNVAYGAD